MDIYIDIIYGSVIGDRDLCLKKSIEIGFLTGEETLRMKDAHVDSVMAVGEPFCKDGEFDFGG
jgi:aarF domain-containing kinase